MAVDKIRQGSDKMETLAQISVKFNEPKNRDFLTESTHPTTQPPTFHPISRYPLSLTISAQNRQQTVKCLQVATAK